MSEPKTVTKETLLSMYTTMVRIREFENQAIELAKEKMDQKNIYLTNPAFDTGKVNG